jgi:uncharacterized membrane protein (DUF106 family)
MAQKKNVSPAVAAVIIIVVIAIIVAVYVMFSRPKTEGIKADDMKAQMQQMMKGQQKMPSAMSESGGEMMKGPGPQKGSSP